VHPPVDGPKHGFGLRGRGRDCAGVCDIDRQDERTPAGGFDLALRGLQCLFITRE
jgi:hypothetical protein